LPTALLLFRHWPAADDFLFMILYIYFRQIDAAPLRHYHFLFSRYAFFFLFSAFRRATDTLRAAALFMLSLEDSADDYCHISQLIG
jgi:hypothetical protein